MNLYETDKLLHEYLLFHYGTEEDILGSFPGPRDALNFPARTVRELLVPGRLPENARAVDIGCAVGRSSFELRRYCASVLGLDYSHRFIDAAHTLQAEGSLSATKLDEGIRFSEFTAALPSQLARDGITFRQGDAMDLGDDLGVFDVVHAANLLCRLPDPRRFLDRLPSLLRSGGQLLLVTPLTWLEEFTPQDRWIGGTPGQDSLTALREILDPHFTLTRTQDMPFLIREHARKFQYTIALGSHWLRR